MMNLYILVTFVILLVVTFFVGRISYKRYIINYLQSGTGKLGIIIYSSYSSRVDHVIEVEQLEEAGDYVKVRVVRVCSTYDYSSSPKKVLSSKSFNQWLKKSSIIWYSDNSQRARDEKIEKILK